MNQLIEQPFELQLNTWFASLQTKLENSAPSIKPWALNCIGELQEMKQDLVEAYRAGDEDLSAIHLALTTRAQEILEELCSMEGPTDFLWLNLPLRSITRFLQGESQTAELPLQLQRALSESKRFIASAPLLDSLQTLCLWSEGHKTLSGLDLRGLVDDVIAQSNKLDFQQSASMTVEALIELCRSSAGELQDQYFEDLLITLEDWDSEFAELSHQVKSLAPEAVDQLTATEEAIDNIAELLEGSFEWDALKNEVSALRNAWTESSAILLPLLSLRHQRVANNFERHQHLRELLQTVQSFQGGTLNLEDYRSQIQVHLSRWSQVTPQLRKLWSARPELCQKIDTAEVCLNSLATVSSPCDARLATVSQLYCQILSQLSNTESYVAENQAA